MPAGQKQSAGLAHVKQVFVPQLHDLHHAASPASKGADCETESEKALDCERERGCSSWAKTKHRQKKDSVPYPTHSYSKGLYHSTFLQEKKLLMQIWNALASKSNSHLTSAFFFFFFKYWNQYYEVIFGHENVVITKVGQGMLQISIITILIYKPGLLEWVLAFVTNGGIFKAREDGRCMNTTVCPSPAHGGPCRLTTRRSVSPRLTSPIAIHPDTEFFSLSPDAQRLSNSRVLREVIFLCREHPWGLCQMALHRAPGNHLRWRVLLLLRGRPPPCRTRPLWAWTCWVVMGLMPSAPHALSLYIYLVYHHFHPHGGGGIHVCWLNE